MKIFVGNLSPEVNEVDWENEFSKYGQVRNIKIIRDMFSQASKGFGFLEMPANMEAMTAIKELNQRYMNILEKRVSEVPGQWFWQHKIWKY